MPVSPDRLRSATGCVVTGLMLCASMPPFGFWPLAPVAFVLLDRLVVDQPRRARFARGFAVALALYVPGLSWMQSLTLPGYLVACLAYAAMLGAGIALAPAGPGRWPALVGTWTLVELLRWSWPFGGVPLASLAVGQVAGPLAPVARVGGALLLVATTVAGRPGRSPRRAGGGSGPPGRCSAPSSRSWWWRPWRRAATTSAPPRSRSCRAAASRARARRTPGVVVPFERHVRATELVTPPVDLVVWPEDVIDTDGAFVDDPWSQVVGDLAGELGAPMIVGVVEDDPDPDLFRNAAVLVDADGDAWSSATTRSIGCRSASSCRCGRCSSASPEDALPGRDLRTVDDRGRLDVPGAVGRVAVAISWEVFFPDRVREGVEDGARLVLNPTNGSSFTGTIVQTQQVASSRLRAIESGRWVLQVAPTGFTAVVDADGDVGRPLRHLRGAGAATGRAPPGGAHDLHAASATRRRWVSPSARWRRASCGSAAGGERVPPRWRGRGCG